MDTQVIDEADEMLNKGFKEQIYDIYRCVPSLFLFRVGPLTPRPATRTVSHPLLIIKNARA